MSRNSINKSEFVRGQTKTKQFSESRLPLSETQNSRKVLYASAKMQMRTQSGESILLFVKLFPRHRARFCFLVYSPGRNPRGFFFRYIYQAAAREDVAFFRRIPTRTFRIRGELIVCKRVFRHNGSINWSKINAGECCGKRYLCRVELLEVMPQLLPIPLLKKKKCQREVCHRD